MLRRAALGVLVWLTATPAGAAGESFQPLAPSLTSHHAPGSSSTEAGLWMVSDEAENTVRTSPRRIVDPKLEAYLKAVVCRLARDYCDDIRIYLVRVPYFNASMLPNGAMQVWTGLLLRVQNEAQLASVLGHELGHYLRQHTLAQFGDLKNKSALLTIFSLGLGGAVAAGGVSSMAAQGASVGAQIAAIGSLMAFSREHESEADRFGIQLIAEAGYAPGEAGAVWGTLLDEDKASGDPPDSPSVFLATHPAPTDRLATLAGYSQALAGQQTESAAATRERYYAAVSPVLRMCFEDELNLNQPRRSEFLFRKLLAGGFAPGLVNYYLGEVERRRTPATQSEAARIYYETSLTMPDAPPEAHRQLGLWHLKARQFVAAREHLQQYLAAAPQAKDREMIVYYLTLTETPP